MPAILARTAARTMLGLMTLLVACSGTGDDVSGNGDAPIESGVTRPDFSGDEAFALLKQQVEFGPRIPGQTGHDKQLSWMLSYLTARADTVKVQEFTQTTSRGETLHLTNLLASFRPELPNRILLVAHWDTRPKANESADSADREKPVPGANDGASGTAVLMQLAELMTKQPPPVGVDLLLVDGEDYGPSDVDMYLGAKYFAAHLPAGYHPLYGILLDMVGDQDLRFPIEGNSQRMAPEVVQRVWSVARDLGYGDIFVNTPGQFIGDDHLSLNEAGIRTIDVIDLNYGPGNRYWHTPQDLPEHTSANSLQIVGEVMAELIYRGG